MSFTNILQSQALYYKGELSSLFSMSTEKADIYQAQARILRDFYNNAFVSSLGLEDDSKINRNYFQRVLGRTVLDIDILFKEGKLVSDEMAEQFNISMDHRTRSRNRIEHLLSLISNLNIMKNEDDNNTASFYDSLSNYSLIDEDMIIGNKAMISTSEGLAHLSTTITRSGLLENKQVKVTGNGTFGNYGSITPLTNPISGYTHKYVSDIDSHESIEAIFDGQNNSWLEYQRVGSRQVPERARKDERIWISQNNLSEVLTFTIRCDLGRVIEANWLDFSQYLPDDSRNGIIIHRINLSSDGTNWSPLYPHSPVIDQRIYAVPQLFDINTSANINKAMSQGTFIFSKRSFRYLEIIINNDESYTKTNSLGYMEYKAVAKIYNNSTKSIQEVSRNISEKDIPQFIIDAPQGVYEYEINGSLFGHPENKVLSQINKRIIPVSGWRYAIGLRNIDLSYREYSTSSILITKKFKTELPIEKVALYTSEIIPAEFADYGVEEKGSWIKYFISTDDKNWYPISPVHHNLVGTVNIPPKFYDFNKDIAIEDKNTLINTAFIDTEEPVREIRLRIEFNRPDELPHATPVLQAYTLKCFLENN